jgi:hypothetical protein
VSRRVKLALLLAAAVGFAACSGSGQDDIVLDTTPDASRPDVTAASTAERGPGSTVDPGTAVDVTVRVDIAEPGPPISPAIRGVTTDTLSTEEMRDAGMTMNSWGGNPITRYNYELGHAFNHGSDFEFRNTSYGNPAGPLAQESVLTQHAAGNQYRLAIPTLGWIAKDADENTCGFPGGSSGCLPQSEAGTCTDPKVAADPTRTSVVSTPEMVGAWLRRMAAAGAEPEYVAMDNEPDLWGQTHYDVHPECPTYEEILARYLEYAEVVATEMPDAALLGPVLCCWFDYWNIAPGPEGEGEEDFLAHFLDGVRAHDERTGERSLDYLDVHFYPQSDVYNDEVDEETSARRLRSTQALWKAAYRDESWIAQPIEFLPRMREVIAGHYPGTKLFVSEWNFGAEETMNGALAIADVLGIFGREGVEAATYYRNPDAGSPGFLAFKLFGNYDDQGGAFEGTSIATSNTEDAAAARVTSYGTYDETTGTLRVMLVNRDPAADLAVEIQTPGFAPAGDTRRFALTPADESAIVADAIDAANPVVLPASSITLLVMQAAG